MDKHLNTRDKPTRPVNAKKGDDCLKKVRALNFHPVKEICSILSLSPFESLEEPGVGKICRNHGRANRRNWRFSRTVSFHPLIPSVGPRVSEGSVFGCGVSARRPRSAQICSPLSMAPGG